MSISETDCLVQALVCRAVWMVGDTGEPLHRHGVSFRRRPAAASQKRYCSARNRGQDHHFATTQRSDLPARAGLHSPRSEAEREIMLYLFKRLAKYLRTYSSSRKVQAGTSRSATSASASGSSNTTPLYARKKSAPKATEHLRSGCTARPHSKATTARSISGVWARWSLSCSLDDIR